MFTDRSPTRTILLSICSGLTRQVGAKVDVQPKLQGTPLQALHLGVNFETGTASHCTTTSDWEGVPQIPPPKHQKVKLKSGAPEWARTWRGHQVLPEVKESILSAKSNYLPCHFGSMASV